MTIKELALSRAIELIEAHAKGNLPYKVDGTVFVACSDDVSGDYLIFTTTEGSAGQIVN